MFDPGTLSLADLMTSLGSFIDVILAGALLLVLWELAILLGAVIGSLEGRREENGEGAARAG